MRLSPVLLLLLALFTTASLSLAQEQDHQRPFVQVDGGAQQAQRIKPKRVAIIGGGASGSSAAYFLSRAERNDIEITLFEKESRLGGRSTTLSHEEDPLLPAGIAPIELGASIFVSANRNMARAAKLFGLKTTESGIGLDDDDSSIGTSIWDGQQFVYEGLDGSWWNSARMIWRYGYSPLTMRNLIADLVGTFVSLYDPAYLHRPRSDPKGERFYSTISGFPWQSIESLAKRLKFDSLIAQTAESWFYVKGVGKLFIEEVIEAATRVNYGQNTNEMHALGAGVSLAASGARAVKGGNWQVFDQFAKRSGATILQGHEGDVTGLVKFEGGWSEAVKQGWISAQEAETQRRDNDPPKWYLATRAGKGYLYDAVILAAPFHSTGIAILNSPAASLVPPQQYVHLHVTLVITSAPQPRPEPFGRSEPDKIPRSVLTTGSGWRKGGKQPDFNSLSYLRRIAREPAPNNDTAPSFLHATLNASTPEDAAASDYLVKIFSQAAVTDERLSQLFGPGTIKWTYRKEWDAYPVLKPTREFPPIQLDEGLYYVNALEPMISTMETSTVSARNVVGLLLEKWYGSAFVHGGKDCPWQTSSSSSANAESSVSESSDGDDDSHQAQQAPRGWWSQKQRRSSHPRRQYSWEEGEDADDSWSGWGCHSG